MDELLEALIAAGYRMTHAQNDGGGKITATFTRKPAEELTKEEKLHG